MEEEPEREEKDEQGDKGGRRRKGRSVVFREPNVPSNLFHV